jgi:hypothetical protein
MTPYLLPIESIAGMWELVCFVGTMLTTLLVWMVNLR